MPIGYLNFIFIVIALQASEGRPARRHSKRISDYSAFAKPPSGDSLVRPINLEPLKPVLANSDQAIKPEPLFAALKQPQTQEIYLKPEPINPEEAIRIPYKARIGGGKIKVQTRPNYISDKRPPIDEKDKDLYQIPPKISDIKLLPYIHRTRGRPAQSVERTTSEYFTQSTRGMSTPTPLPPWRSQQFIDLVQEQTGGDTSWDTLRAYRTVASLEATSTTLDFSSDCNCQVIEHDKLYNYLILADNYGYEHIPSYRARLDLMRMGLYTNEQAKRCYRHCRQHTPSISQSYSSRLMPTHASNEIEIVTGAVDPDATSMIHARQHCYMTLKHRNVTANDSRLCYMNYKPTKDSPHPSSKPEGLNVWTCCKTITPRGYYYG